MTGFVQPELARLNQWVGYKNEPDASGKPTKLPYNPHNGKRASVTDPSTWGCYSDVFTAVDKYSLDGPGFVFAPGGEITGIDLDRCRDPETGEIAQWAEEFITLVNSYTEISPSGTGVHILIRGTLPPR